MTAASPLLGAVRAALEAAYGLALEGLGDDQIEVAVHGAGAFDSAGVEDPQYLSRVVDRLPIDESWLFRDDALWDWLRDEAGPEVLEQAGRGGRPVRVLSLGCSGGQEAYSAAFLLLDLLEGLGVPASGAPGRLQVVGIDSSPARVEAARSGLLPAWSVQRCRPDWLRGRISAEPGPLTRYRLPAAVQAVCRFEQGNLLEVAARGNLTLGGFDLVFCRHVLIYFRAAAAAGIAAALGRGLDPGSYLVFSAAEAHLVAASGLSPSTQLGVGRSPPRATPAPWRAVRRRAGRSRPLGPLHSPLPLMERSPVPPAEAKAAPGREEAVAEHLGRALRLAGAGQGDEALCEVRAALVHDPRHLYSRLLLGQQLIGVDASRGREVLRELVEAASRLPSNDAVPFADGLSVGQLAAAARLLLARQEGA